MDNEQRTMNNEQVRGQVPVEPGRRPSTLLAYLQLMRLPNVFTALADVAMGFLFVRRAVEPWGAFLALAAASALLYTAGVVLNDVYDFAVDVRERPERPLPSGRIPLGRARRLGYQLLALGVALGWLGGYAASATMPCAWRAGLVACCLALCIWLYDASLKSSWFGPWLMGSCRFLNVLMGMSLGSAEHPPLGIGHFPADQLLVAGGIGCYIAGVTWYARGETMVSRRGPLTLGVALMIAGLACLALFPRVAPAGARYSMQQPQWLWPMALLLLTVPTWRRCLAGVMDPSPRRVQVAVKQCLLSLIVLDASVCLVACPLHCALGVLALLVPSVILGRWVYST